MSRGRPPNPEKQEKTRSALLQAAKSLLHHKSYKSISIRELAQQADTQPAMISYYFGNKQGLFQALILQTAESRQVLLAGVASDAATDPDKTLDILVSRIVDALLSEQWLFRLLQDEVISTTSDLRALIIAELPRRIHDNLTHLLTTLRDQGAVRESLNIRFFIASFMSLMIFPLLTQPLLQESLGIDRTTIASDEWKAHITLLLKQGIAP